jgi:D-alanyl-D-alanine carboxypeptidase
VGAAGLYLAFVGIRDVPFTEGLRQLFRREAPTPRQTHTPYTFGNIVKGVTTVAEGVSSGVGFSGPVDMSQTVVVSGIRVNRSIADNVKRMIEDARKDGIVLTGSGWRSKLQQIAARIANGYTSDSQASGSGGRTPVAVPGSSRHEAGLAIDFTTNGRSIRKSDKEFSWLSANAAKYGFQNLPSESWHWSVDGK